MADPPGPEQRQRALDEALSDPLRARILEALWTRVCSANELVPVVGMPADRLDHRLAELVDAGLVDEYPPHDDTGAVVYHLSLFAQLGSGSTGRHP